SRMASSSSRASRSGQNCAPSPSIASALAGGGASGPRNVMVARRSAITTESVLYSVRLSVRSRLSGSSLIPFVSPGRFELAANSLARLATVSSSLEPGTTPPPSRQSTARFPLTPPSVVAFCRRAERVGEIAPHLAFVGHAGKPTGAGQHREQWQLGQRHRGGAVIDQHDVVGRKRKLIAATRRRAVDHTNGLEVGG